MQKTVAPMMQVNLKVARTPMEMAYTMVSMLVLTRLVPIKTKVVLN